MIDYKEKVIKDNAINEYIDDMKSKLLNGEDFVINGVGVLRPVYRRVKNDNGRNFTVRVRMDYFWDFYTKIIDSCKVDNSKFVRKVRSRNNVAKYLESDKAKESRANRAISN